MLDRKISYEAIIILYTLTMYRALFKSNLISFFLRSFTFIPFIAIGIFARPLFFIVYGLFDIWLLFWVLMLKIASTFRSKIKITDSALFPSICWTTDIHYSGNMYNARYLRELDNARHDFGFRSGLTDYILSIKGGTAVVQASTILYQRPIKFLQSYTITTRIIWFDEKALYFEQCFVTKDANNNADIISALVLLKCPILNINVKEMMNKVFNTKDIQIDQEKQKELRLFVQINEVSSSRLRGLRKD